VDTITSTYKISLMIAISVRVRDTVRIMAKNRVSSFVYI